MDGSGAREAHPAGRRRRGRGRTASWTPSRRRSIFAATALCTAPRARPRSSAAVRARRSHQSWERAGGSKGWRARWTDSWGSRWSRARRRRCGRSERAASQMSADPRAACAASGAPWGNAQCPFARCVVLRVFSIDLCTSAANSKRNSHACSVPPFAWGGALGAPRLATASRDRLACFAGLSTTAAPL